MQTTAQQSAVKFPGNPDSFMPRLGYGTYSDRVARAVELHGSLEAYAVECWRGLFRHHRKEVRQWIGNIRNAPNAEWRERGYANLRDELNRRRVMWREFLAWRAEMDSAEPLQAAAE